MLAAGRRDRQLHRHTGTDRSPGTLWSDAESGDTSSMETLAAVLDLEGRYGRATGGSVTAMLEIADRLRAAGQDDDAHRWLGRAAENGYPATHAGRRKAPARLRSRRDDIDLERAGQPEEAVRRWWRVVETGWRPRIREPAHALARLSGIS
jgi:hypothetical protein